MGHCGFIMAHGRELRMYRRLLISPKKPDQTEPKVETAYLWQYSRPGGPVVFDFQLDRGRQGPRQFLGGFAVILQTDGYTGYGKLGTKIWCDAGVVS